MEKRETASEINDRAAEWVARIDRHGVDGNAVAELEAWLAGDPRRQGAYLRAEAAWQMLDKASVFGAGQGIAESEGVSRRKLIWGSGAAVASLAAVTAGAVYWQQTSGWIETAIGEIRRVPLTDGSLAAVNTSTRVRVNMQPESRRVDIARGEAWFQVARDRARPFIVDAGAVRIRALGTAFSVRRRSGGADVQVTEGVVEVWSVHDDRLSRRIPAGTRTFVSDESGPAPPVAAASEIERELSWRTGQLIFDGDPLWQAAAEFNRYNVVQVTIADAALAQERLVGRFHTNEPDAFARAAASTLGAHADFQDGRIILSRG